MHTEQPQIQGLECRHAEQLWLWDLCRIRGCCQPWSQGSPPAAPLGVPDTAASASSGVLWQWWLLVTPVIKAADVVFSAGCWGLHQQTQQRPFLWTLWEVCGCHGEFWDPWWKRLPGFPEKQAAEDHDDTFTWLMQIAPNFLFIPHHPQTAPLQWCPWWSFVSWPFLFHYVAVGS